MLSQTQLGRIQVIKSLIKEEGKLTADYTYPNYNEYHESRKRLDKQIRNELRWILVEWATTRGIQDPKVRTEIEYDGKKFRDLGFVSLYNSFGGLNPKSWINKITVLIEKGQPQIVSHRAQTDERFLAPTHIEFANFVLEVDQELRK